MKSITGLRRMNIQEFISESEDNSPALGNNSNIVRVPNSNLNVDYKGRGEKVAISATQQHRREVVVDKPYVFNGSITINLPALSTGREISENMEMEIVQGIPFGRLWAEVRDRGEVRRHYSGNVKLRGNLFVEIPGSEVGYVAEGAEVYWHTPMEVDVLALFGKLKGMPDVQGIEAIVAGKLDFHSQSRASMIKDPNIILFAGDNRIDIKHALGVPRIYAINAIVKYKNG